MARMSAEEMRTATLIPLDSVLSGDEDAETAFNDFRAGFDTGEEPGTIRAWKLQIDERGNIGTTKAQTRLGAWPVDAYTLDELCQLLVNEFLQPGEEMAVRLVGTKKDQTGYKFNKIIMLRRSLKKETSSPPVDNTASIMKMMQEMNERNMAMFQRMQATPAEKPDTMAEIQKMMAFAQTMNAPMMGMLQSLLPALVGRPPPAAGADPFASVGGLLDVAERLSDMRGGGGSSGGDDDSWVSILKAITPLAKPALEALPAIAAMAPKPAPRIAAPPTAPRPLPPGSVPTPPTPPNVQTLQPTDLPTGDSAMLAQMKPQIDSLVQMAEQGSDATGSADMIFDQVMSDPRLPEEAYEKLADFIDSDQFVSYVILMNPAAKPHAAWFEAFKAQVVKRLLAEDAAAGEAPSNAHDTVGL